jgi:hypothetical protein
LVQLLLEVHCGGGGGAFWQEPFWQTWPLAHWLSAVQAWHWPPTQTWPPPQSPFDEHCEEPPGMHCAFGPQTSPGLHSESARQPRQPRSTQTRPDWQSWLLAQGSRQTFWAQTLPDGQSRSVEQWRRWRSDSEEESADRPLPQAARTSARTAATDAKAREFMGRASCPATRDAASVG